MERAGALINKLKEQLARQESAEQLAATAQLLLAELQKNCGSLQADSHMSAIFPSLAKSFTEEEPNTQFHPGYSLAETKRQNGQASFDISHDIPTLAHQNYVPRADQPYTITEFNTVLSRQTESLNDKLKDDHQEVVTALQSSPIRDLKKAIGINDRFLFVQDLFRGDENMYERSIKTINGFSIYAEAQYWIQRELKIKLSWPDDSDTVILFDQLVKRRFS